MALQAARLQPLPPEGVVGQEHRIDDADNVTIDGYRRSQLLIGQ
jgi:hypothetical protein